MFGLVFFITAARGRIATAAVTSSVAAAGVEAVVVAKRIYKRDQLSL